LNYRQIEAFEAVMKTGSMTLAGKLLFITQPAVSRLIIELEQELGFKLFERKKNRLFRTDESQLFFEEVEKSFIGLSELKKSAESIKELKKGYLRIIAMPGVSNLMLPKVMEKFWSSNPNINVEIESHPRTVVLDWIQSKQFDLAIVNLPIDINFGKPYMPIESREIYVECNFDLKMFCVIPEIHPLSEKNILTFNDISGQNFVSFPNGTYIRYEIDRILEKNHVNCRVKLETRSTADIYQYVKHGAGISIVFPFLQFGEKPIPGILFKPVKSNLKLSLAIMRSKRKELSLVAKKFLEIIGQFS
jgi:DNA-binding transcriptional LysR family regulator